jgi:hypothetical protein
MSLRSPSRALTRIGAVAAAHIETEPGQGPKGDDATITFRVPNEEESAGVTKLEVDFPLDHPVPEARMADNTDKLTFKALQTYSNGDVVRWIYPPAAEAEHPAPTLTLVSDDADAGPAKPAGAAASTSSADDTARWLGGAGVVIGILGLALGIVIAARGRRSTVPASKPLPE